MKVEIEEREKPRLCPSEHRCFYTIKEGDKSYCMIGYALGFAKRHQYEQVKEFIIDTLYGKQIDVLKMQQAQLKN